MGRNTVMCQFQRKKTKKKNEDLADKTIEPGFIEKSVREKWVTIKIILIRITCK